VKRESLENEHVALLTEVKKRNNEAVLKEKMQRTFSYRRQEVVQDAPVISDLLNRWPALFTVSEVSTGIDVLHAVQMFLLVFLFYSVKFLYSKFLVICYFPQY